MCGCRWWQQALGTCECSIIPLTHSSSAMWWAGPHPQMASSVFSLSPSPMLLSSFPCSHFFSSLRVSLSSLPLPFTLLHSLCVVPFPCSPCLLSLPSLVPAAFPLIFLLQLAQSYIVSKLGAMLPIVTCKAPLSARCCSLTTLPSLFPRVSHMRHLFFLYNLTCSSVCSVLSHHLSAHSLTYCSVCFAGSRCLCGHQPPQVYTVHAHI